MADLGLSTHRVEVVRLGAIERHPNADRLGIVRIHGGYPCVVQLAAWGEGDLAAYVPPDSLVPVADPASPFRFLRTGDETMVRVRAKKLRGVVSMGLLVPPPPGAVEGDDVAGAFGVRHWEPPPESTLSTGGEAEAPPPGWRPHYDVDSFRRYVDAFTPGEPVIVTEKIHGAQGRFAWVSPQRPGDGRVCMTDDRRGRFHCASKKEWKRKGDDNLWWRAIAAEPGLAAFIREHPERTVYGEVYGRVHDLHYGTAHGEVRVAVFDIADAAEAGGWMDFRDVYRLAARYEFETVPVLAWDMPFDVDAVLALAEGASRVRGADHVREGIVVRPATGERRDDRFGRVVLKVVGAGYLAR